MRIEVAFRRALLGSASSGARVHFRSKRTMDGAMSEPSRTRKPPSRVVGHEIEFVTIILWESLEDVRALAGDDYEKALIPEDRLPLLSRYDARAAHYEVVSTNEPARR
jgi:hypothetical protein